MTYDDLMDGRQEQLEREDAAETRRVQREAGRAFDRLAAQADRQATQSASDAGFTSEPLPGRQSAFYSSDGRYWSSSEDARRAQMELDSAEARQAARARVREAIATVAAPTDPYTGAPVHIGRAA